MRNRLPFIILTSCIFLMNTVSLSAAIDSLECNKDIAQTTVHSTATGLGEVLKNIKDERDRIHLIRSFVDPIRFYPDKSGYFYVYDYDCVNIAHTTQKELVGKNLYDYTDCKGKFVIRELAEAARKGGGFVENYWAKPGLKGEHKKISYVEPIPNTEYFIGTGLYFAEMTSDETLVQQSWADLKDRRIEAGQEKIHTSRLTPFSREVIATSSAPEAIGPYSQAIKIGNMLFVSGQIGIDADSGKIVKGGIEAETKQVINNLKFILQAAGFSMADVVQVQVFLADISEYKQMNEIYASFFHDSLPARVTIQAAMIPKDARVEISLIAGKAMRDVHK